MPLSAGTRLGVYEVTALIGEGGMGQVYRARDTKLNRDVALKIVPDAFANDPDRLVRFTREAQTLAALNNPNIAHIHGLEEAGNVRALVMELVEGEDLARRIARGAIPIDQALRIAKQIAEALEAAHEKGIIHRDLKPANIMLTSELQVKVLDFGLAKAAEPTASGALASSPTVASPAMMTSVGMIIGTAAYMSPEQAKGRTVDKRSDIWAFGCVLYEMLSGTRAFDGHDINDALISVLTKEPDWSALNGNTPAPILKVLTRCLEKERKRRLADVADARLEIDDVISASGSRQVRVTSVSSDARGAQGQRVLPWGVAAIACLTAIAMLLLWAPWQNARPLALVRVSADLGAVVSLVTTQGAAAVLSPDGTTMAFVGQPSAGGAPPQIYLRRLEELTALPLAGTDGAMNPFFSPDGRWIAFCSDGKLKKIAVTGGGAVTLAAAPNGRGGTWGDDDTLVFMPDLSAGLWRVPAGGGEAVRVTTLADGDATHRWPQLLPGGHAVLYTSHKSLTGYEDATLVVQPLPTGSPRVVHRGGYYGRYLSSGHLVYMHEGTLFAAPFDLERLEASGEPVPVVQDVVGGAFWTGGAQFAAAGNGTALYVPGSSDALPIQWVDDSGNTSFLRGTPANWSDLSFSPDGRHLGMDISDGKQSNIWVYEWARDALSRLTFDSADDFKPVWTPDGRRIVFGSTRGGKGAFNLYWQRVDGTGDVQRLTESPNSQIPASWHPSGKFLAYVEFSPETSFDVMILPLEGDEGSGWKPGKPRPFLNGRAVELEPMFSPDGRWLAYFSNESGRFEVYVRPFPGPGGPWQVSSAGGSWPTWSRRRPELFYGTLDQRIMVAPYSTLRDSFRAEPPKSWMEGRYNSRGPVTNRSFDLHPDGKRVALAKAADSQNPQRDKIVLIFNFFDELRRVVPAPKR